MTVVLTVLSVLALWSLLAVLIVALMLIHKVLSSIRTTLEQIAMGVRAIEQQTLHLGDRSDGLARALSEGADGLASTVAALAALPSRFDRAASILRRS